MNLRPQQHVHKALLSTTSHLTGEYESDGVLITHAWPDFFGGQQATTRLQEGPGSRSAILLAFESSVAATPEGGVANHSGRAHGVCASLSVLYGKRFDFHGMVESCGYFHTPDMTEFSTYCNPNAPHNNHEPRKTLPVPLNLTEVQRINSLLLDSKLNSKFATVFNTAASFYLQALQNMERETEIAYLHLITAMEVVSNFYDYDSAELLDEQLAKALLKIRQEVEGGDKVAALIEERMYFVKKRFVSTVCGLVDQEFFSNSESSKPIRAFSSETFERAIKAAYDLRSKYVHTGTPFGVWVIHPGDLGIGTPVVLDKDYRKALERAPMLQGLERTVRFCLLKFAEENGAYVAR